MKKLRYKLSAVLLMLLCAAVFARTYNFSQGYIFDQKYITRISLEKAEKVSGVDGVFDQLITWNWPPEKIESNRIERVGSRLIIKFANKPVLDLQDFSTSLGDGETQLFKYLKSVPNYHIVGVVFGHDQPAFLLVHESGSDIYFVETQ